MAKNDCRLFWRYPSGLSFHASWGKFRCDKYPIDKFSEKDQKGFIEGMASGFLRQSPSGSTVKSTSIIKLENGHSAGLMELTYGKDEGSASAVAIIYNQEAYMLVITSKKQDLFEKNKDKFISYFKTFKVKE